MINPGATPKLTTSANESNCLPISEEAFKSLATKPSRKSITAAQPINTDAINIFSGIITNASAFSLTVKDNPFCKMQTMARQPKTRLSKVKILGICFIMNLKI